jgi:hypothetical protein
MSFIGCRAYPNAKGRSLVGSAPSTRGWEEARPSSPEDLRDLVDRVEELLTLLGILRLLGRAGLLRRPPEQVVQLRMLLEVLRLEVVGPQHPQVLLDQVRALLLDRERARSVVLVGLAGRLELLGVLVAGLRGLHRFSLDARLRRVVDAAR